jgi:endonuclease III
VTHPGLGPRALVELLGPHPVRQLGLDLDSEEGLARWLLAASLLGGRAGESAGLEAVRRLAAAGLDGPAALASAGVAAAAEVLAAGGYPQPEAAAGRLVRAARGLLAGAGLEERAAAAAGLEELGAGLSSLAPGVGPATLRRFLQPLRERWSAAGDLPLDDAARPAAVHLGWIDSAEDTEGAPGALRARLLDEPEAPALADVEAALARLGRAACRAERPARCPLGPRCPARRAGG